ncbi:MAG: TetR/AcrR family transcriptional regulator [Desulfobacteraceae bacterium]|nr:MAG: TetR/AcrR family transcriptional regulator [Desulfobacteraceae bacterium]
MNSKKGDVKEKIIRESIRLFLANGFKGTSVEEITKAVGVGKGTLYWYFKSKDEILQSIFRKFEHDFVDALIGAVSDCDGNFTAKYKVYHKVATEFARDDRDLSLASNALLSEIVGSNTESEKLVRAVYERYRKFVQTMLEDGKKDGSVDPELDTVLYSHVINACHTGMLVQWFLNGETLDVRSFVRTFRDAILRMVTEGTAK